jgi:hypothetical protein
MNRMKAKIIGFKSNGDLENERVILRMLADEDIGHYILFETTYQDGGVSNIMQHPYWIPDTLVRQGDFVVIYTKKENYRKKRNSLGFDTHFLYRGLEEPVLNNDRHCVTIMDIKEWDFLPIKEDK